MAEELPEIVVQDHAVSRADLVRWNPTTGAPDEIATLVVEGMLYEDWESVWIQYNWNEWFSYFRLTCAEREPYPDTADVLQLKPGDECEIYLGGILVIKGVIMTRQIAYDANQHMVQLQGVSASWFATRSSIEHKDSDFDGKTFTQIAGEVLAPTRVDFDVIPQLDETPFKAGASPSPGESIGEFLERLARDRKIIVSNRPTGEVLFIGEHGFPPVGDLVEGINIKKMQCVITDEGARSEFITRAQKKANDQSYGREASEQEARVQGILGRYSILLTAMEHPVWTPQEVAKRNDTEQMWNEDLTRIDATVTVYGWFRPSPTTVASWGRATPGQTGHVLWMAGDEVIVKSPMAMLNNYPLKIKSVQWTQDRQNGTQTILQLTTPRGLNSKTPIPRQPRREQSQPNTDPPKTPEVWRIPQG